MLPPFSWININRRGPRTCPRRVFGVTGGHLLPLILPSTFRKHWSLRTCSDAPLRAVRAQPARKFESTTTATPGQKGFEGETAPNWATTLVRF